jgi:hypothetical protein
MMQNKLRARVLQRCQCHAAASLSSLNRPAPIITLDNPLHSVRKPSTREMVTMALDIPLYIAPGDGLMIWILVFPESALRSHEFASSRESRVPSASRRGT